MLKKHGKKISVALLVLMILSLGSVSFADNIKNLREEQDGIKKEIKETEDKLKDSQKQSKTVEEQIDELDQKMNRASIELTKVEDDLAQLEIDIAQNEKELEEAEQILVEKQENFESRIRAMYINGDVGYLELLLSSKDIQDFFSRKDMVKSIAEQDKNLLKVMKEQKEIIEEKKSELEGQRASLASTRAKLQSSKNNLEIATREKEDLMSRLQEDVDSYEKEYNKLNDFSLKVGDEITKLQKEQEERERAERAAEEAAQAKKRESEKTAEQAKKSSSNGSTSSAPDNPPSNAPTNGRMMWPVLGYGRVSSPFGYRVHPIFGSSNLHTGIDIPAPTGANVVAASGGVVIKSGWFSSYGNTVMIDHGGGMVTLYAHNSSTVVNVGQSVGAGSVIAKIGSTGNSTGPHSHFEVRKNGNPVDPLPWVR